MVLIIHDTDEIFPCHEKKAPGRVLFFCLKAVFYAFAGADAACFCA